MKYIVVEKFIYFCQWKLSPQCSQYLKANYLLWGHVSAPPSHRRVVVVELVHRGLHFATAGSQLRAFEQLVVARHGVGGMHNRNHVFGVSPHRVRRVADGRTVDHLKRGVCVHRRPISALLRVLGFRLIEVFYEGLWSLSVCCVSNAGRLFVGNLRTIAVVYTPRRSGCIEPSTVTWVSTVAAVASVELVLVIFILGHHRLSLEEVGGSKSERSTQKKTIQDPVHPGPLAHGQLLLGQENGPE